MKVEEYREKLNNIPNRTVKKYLEDIAFELEMESLGHSVLPDDIFGLYITLFKDIEFCCKKGAYHFVSGLYSKVYKLSEPQKQELLRVLVNNFEFYDGIDFRLWICTFFAKCFEANTCIAIFEDLEKKFEFEKIHEILVALESIMYHLDTDSLEWKRASLLCKKIQNKE
ncbi:hypothetical protein [Kiloniella laminariae]|uniref:hypothetical protein n=1 Tax=Kiloniella laminariae TaxID=454162 RepID=UPI0012FCC962|nr:hypothetical protein [Kiloniella laminariae]